MAILDRPAPTVNPADESDPCEWPSWTDNWFIETTDDTEADLASAWDGPITAPDDPAPAELTLAEMVEQQAARFRSWASEAGELLAGAMDELALKIRMTGAATPADYTARIEVIEDDRHEASYRAGYADGLAAGRCERPGPAMGHPA